MTLKEFRKDRGLTQRELGEKIGISTSAVSQVESGEKPMPYEARGRFVKYFPKYEVEEVINGAKAPQEKQEDLASHIHLLRIGTGDLFAYSSLEKVKEAILESILEDPESFGIHYYTTELL